MEPNEVQKILNSVGQKCLPNELAYLALTSKIEIPIRDKFAFLLKGPGNQKVAREYPLGGRKAADSAFLEDGAVEPSTYFEFKAAYTFDSYHNAHINNDQNIPNNNFQTSGFFKDLVVDLTKYININQNSNLYFLSLVTHILNPIPGDLLTIVKYSNKLNAVFNNGILADQMIENTNLKFNEIQNELELECISGTIVGGVAYDIPVNILFYIFGPFNHGSINQICQSFRFID